MMTSECDTNSAQLKAVYGYTRYLFCMDRSHDRQECYMMDPHWTVSVEWKLILASSLLQETAQLTRIMQHVKTNPPQRMGEEKSLCG